ncbi:hypothetical protein TrLO_g12880 [Triparma laevis f. longispina]|uniref:RNA methyltransferase n=1 Tax=Triparma laevis f. longispina TaxID=1714387 RepID=A0A9W7AML4_9STRA|nr:hypothetical protein TrLO_g12880 [Triparma laevis f. longispina]
MDGPSEKKRKKAEARESKKAAIAANGGERPRKKNKEQNEGNKKSLNASGKNARSNSAGTKVKTTVFKRGGKGGVDRTGTQEVFKPSVVGGMGDDRNSGVSGKFGRVMSKLPSISCPRHDTLSIAVPTSIVANAQSKELKTMLCGQIARAATIYNVDEIVLYEDVEGGKNEDTSSNDKRNPLQFMQRVLEYAETPQYLKQSLHPNHADLQFAGLIPPIDAPHHVRRGEQSKYREGVTLDTKDKPEAEGGGRATYVNCGVGKDVEIDRKIPKGVRVTVEIENYKAKDIKGKAVKSSSGREENGDYWGYSVRGVKGGLKGVLEGGPWGEYDWKVGTSERGTTINEALHGHSRAGKPSDGGRFSKLYKHMLLVFGGVHGIEQCVDDDEDFPHVSGVDCGELLFDTFINTVPLQGSRTVRSEEAILLTLAQLRSANINNTRDRYLESQRKKEEEEREEKRKKIDGMEFSDKELSEEESDDDGD